MSIPNECTVHSQSDMVQYKGPVVSQLVSYDTMIFYEWCKDDCQGLATKAGQITQNIATSHILRLPNQESSTSTTLRLFSTRTRSSGGELNAPV